MTAHQIVILSDEEATRLTPLGTHSGMDITVQSINDAGYIFLGGSGVTDTSFGYRLAPGHAISFELPGRDALYAIASDPDMRISIIKIGLEAQD